VSGPALASRDRASCVIPATAGLVTTTTLTSSANPASIGQPVRLTAKVSVQPPGDAVRDGDQVKFYEGTQLLGVAQVSQGEAVLSVGTFAAGTHGFTAAYVPSNTYEGSTSTVLSQVVNGLSTSSLTVLNASPNRVLPGGAVTLSATVFPTSAGGTVTFDDGFDSLGSSPLVSGSAVLRVFSTRLAGHPLAARYNGNAVYAGSASQPVVVNVSDAHLSKSSVSVSISPNRISFGTSTTVSSAVSAPGKTAPSGTAILFVDGFSIANGPLIVAGNTSTISTRLLDLSRGNHVITVVYTGNSLVAGATSVPVLVNVR